MSKYTPSKEVTEHPLFPVFCAAIEQAMNGKGKRHGGASVPFLEQPLFHYAKMHGRGFLTGQAAKKLEEAASTRQGDAFDIEVLGALVYAGAAALDERMRHPKGTISGLDMTLGKIVAQTSGGVMNCATEDLGSFSVAGTALDKASGLVEWLDKASGWVEWRPLRTSCSPVAPDINVEVLLECGTQVTRRARDFDWSNNPERQHHIKAYRIVG